MEQYLLQTFNILKDINDKHALDQISPEYYIESIKEFALQKKEFINFLKKAKKMNIKENKRDILWTLVFSYRDFCVAMRLFEVVTKNMSQALKEKIDVEAITKKA